MYARYSCSSITTRAKEHRQGTAKRWEHLVHSLSCQLPVYTGLSIGAANIAVIGILPVITMPSRLGTSVALAGSGIAVVSFTANRYWARHFGESLQAYDESIKSHYRLDMYASVAVVIGNLCTAISGNINWVVLGVGIILGLSLIETLPQLRQTVRHVHTTPHHPPTHVDHDGA